MGAYAHLVFDYRFSGFGVSLREIWAILRRLKLDPRQRVAVIRGVISFAVALLANFYLRRLQLYRLHTIRIS